MSLTKFRAENVQLYSLKSATNSFNVDSLGPLTSEIQTIITGLLFTEQLLISVQDSQWNYQKLLFSLLQSWTQTSSNAKTDRLYVAALCAQVVRIRNTVGSWLNVSLPT